MTTQEIREMLDSTITANGKRAISGQSLNTALHVILDFIEEYTPDNTWVEVDQELRPDSPNPIANSTVTNALRTLVENALLKENLLMIDLRNGGAEIRSAFEKYNLANRLNTPISCLILEDDSRYSTSTMIVEGFDSSMAQDGTDTYKVNFLTFDFTTKVPFSDVYMPKYAWSGSGVANNFTNKAYIYSPATNIIQSLGSGAVTIPTLKTIFREDLSRDNMQVGNLYLAFDKEKVQEAKDAGRGNFPGYGSYAIIEDPIAMLEGKKNMVYMALSAESDGKIIPYILDSIA